MNAVEVGATYEVPCPFVREAFAKFDEAPRLTWRPGVQWEAYGPYGDYSEAIAHGVGQVVYHVVSVHQLPRPYPARVFFTRKWVDPDGRTFGKSALRIITKHAFERRLRGYRFGGSEGGEFIIKRLTKEDQAALLPPLPNSVEEERG